MPQASLTPSPSIKAASVTGYCLVDDHGTIVGADEYVRGWLRACDKSGVAGVTELFKIAVNDENESSGPYLPREEARFAYFSDGPFEAVLAVGEHQGQVVRGVARRLDGSAGPLTLIALQLSTAEESQFVDPLTGLPDRREIAVRIDAWRRREPDACFAVLFVDLDDFKQINDRHGHLVGDWVLQELAQRWLHCVREGDLVARYGGDEFVILLKGAHENREVQHIVERLQRETAEPMAIDGRLIRITAAVGAAISAAPMQSIDALIAHADRDMYQAKHKRPR